MSTKKCKDFCEQFSDYLDGEIGPAECRMLEDHLAECSRCAIIYKSLETTVEISKHALSEAVPEEIRDRLKALLRQRCRNEHFHQ
jgi:anti-sigma factor RsiW